MAIITQTDKRTGITYAYENIYYWDKEKSSPVKKYYLLERLILRPVRLFQQGAVQKRKQRNLSLRL